MKWLAQPWPKCCRNHGHIRRFGYCLWTYYTTTLSSRSYCVLYCYIDVLQTILYLFKWLAGSQPYTARILTYYHFGFVTDLWLGRLGLGLGSYQFSSTVKVPTWTKRATRYYYNLFNVSALPARWGRYSTWLKGGVIQGYWWSVDYSTHFKFQVNIPTFHLQIKISQNRWGYGNGAAVLHMSSHMRGQLNI